MSEGGDDVQGSQINNVFCIYKSVKISIHFKQFDYLDQLKTTTTGKIMETPTPTPTTEIEIDWSVNKQIRLKNGDVVLLSIEIEIDSEIHYFPFTNDGLNLAFDLYHEHIVEMRSDVNFNWSLLADNMVDSNDYITMKDLNPREWLNVYNRLHQQTIGQ